MALRLPTNFIDPFRPGVFEAIILVSVILDLFWQIVPKLNSSEEIEFEGAQKYL